MEQEDSKKKFINQIKNRGHQLATFDMIAPISILTKGYPGIEFPIGAPATQTGAKILLGGLFTMNQTQIEWTDLTWNPITDCLRGCSYCCRMAYRLRGRFGYPQYNPFRQFIIGATGGKLVRHSNDTPIPGRICKKGTIELISQFFLRVISELPLRRFTAFIAVLIFAKV